MRRLFNIIDVNYPSLERTSKFLIRLVCGGISSNNRLMDESQKSLFIEIRNFIADEWIYRNIKGPGTKVKKKDLNYLKYTLEEYQRFKVALEQWVNFYKNARIIYSEECIREIIEEV